MKPVAIMGQSSARDAPDDLEDRFDAYWDSRRALHPDLRPLVWAVAGACQEAGWWSPGERVSGGLVVGVDLHGVEPADRFQAALARGVMPRPRDFLHSLPSTPATTLGLLFGLQQYQTTVTTFGLSGIQAVGHALDLLRLERLERVVVAALSATSEKDSTFRLAVALCLEAGARPDLPRLDGYEVKQNDPGPTALLSDIPSGYRGLAAPGLLAVSHASRRSGRQVVVHQDPRFGGWGRVELSGAGGE